ncbi:hypothetical protein PWYN_05820 [Paenibacillus wynnii]|uniref:Uncharacterized protein n=1 Tax=Paenibacillus wynnii TaxID=268407 RepID=A0A098MA39_9BACL|nr:hypothetical protein PWYN_05820 [Paenibacillus wynnii]
MWTLRERTVAPIAVVSRFFEFYLNGINPEPDTAYAFEASFPSENLQANAVAFPQSVRSLRCIQREQTILLSYTNLLDPTENSEVVSEIDVYYTLISSL